MNGLRKRLFPSYILLFSFILFLCAPAAVPSAQAVDFMARVSVSSEGVEADGASAGGSISGTGRYVVFDSAAANLETDSNGVSDVYLHDRDADGNGVLDEPGGIETTRVSVGMGGAETDGPSYGGVISADGYHVAFISEASNLDGLSAPAGVFVYNRLTDSIVRASVDYYGVAANGSFGSVFLSADGKYVVFDTTSNNLSIFDTNTLSDIYVHDRDLDFDGIYDEPGAISTNLYSRNFLGENLDAPAESPVMSGTGQYIAFATAATNLVADDTNGTSDVFIIDLFAGKITRVSVRDDGSEGQGDSGLFANGGIGISDNGRFVTFASTATDLATTPSGLTTAVYIHDRDADGDFVFDEPGAIRTTQMSLPSMAPSAAVQSHPSISADGLNGAFVYGDHIARYDHDTGSSQLVTNNAIGAYADGASTTPKISRDGLQLAFASAATDLVADDGNNVSDIFVTSETRLVGGTLPPLNWQLQTLDVGGDAGAYTGMALDSKGYPHIAYISRQGPFISVLNYARWDGVMWQVATVDEGSNFDEGVSIALNDNDRPYISYHDVPSRDLKMATFINGEWRIERVRSEGDVGRLSEIAVHSGALHIIYLNGSTGMLDHSTRVVGRWEHHSVGPSNVLAKRYGLALDSADNPHVAFYDVQAERLKYGSFDGSDWSVRIVDDLPGGVYATLALDDEDLAHIIYQDANGSLIYAREGSNFWSLENVASHAGVYSSIAFDNNGKIAVSYFEPSKNRLALARRPGAAWSVETVDGPNVGLFSRLAFDNENRPHIAYYDQAWGDLKYAYPDAAWQFRTVVSGAYETAPVLALNGGAPAVSYHRQVASPPALFLREWQGDSWQEASAYIGALTDASLRSSIEYDSAGRPHVAYYDDSYDEVFHAVWDGTQWQRESVWANPPALNWTMGERIELRLLGGDNAVVVFTIDHEIGSSFMLARRTADGWQTPHQIGLGAYLGGPDLWDMDITTDQEVVVAYAHSNILAVATWDGTQTRFGTISPDVSVQGLALAVERRLVMAEEEGVDYESLDTYAVAFIDGTSKRMRYMIGDGSATWFESIFQFESAAINGSEIELALVDGSNVRPRIAYFEDNNAIRLVSTDGINSSWKYEYIALASTAPRSHLTLDLSDRERVIYQEGVDAASTIIHAFRTENIAAAPVQYGGISIEALGAGECVCVFASWVANNLGIVQQCYRFFEDQMLGGGDQPLLPDTLANGLLNDDPLGAQLTVLFYETAEGAALVDTYLAHDYEMWTLLGGDADMAWDSYRTLYNFMPGLAALTSGRGDTVVVTQAMVDHALPIWQYLAAEGSPELAAEINTRLTETNELQDYVGMTFNEWAESLGVVPPEKPSEALYLPLIVD